MGFDSQAGSHTAPEFGAGRCAAFRLHDRLRASGLHLFFCVSVAIAVLALVYLLWYPGPLDLVSGVGGILPILLAIDVVLGPILTFVVFDRRKRSLRADLACIGVLQLSALLYGLHAVELGRPHYLVFVKDRFEAVSRADIRPEDYEAARDNRAAQVSWFWPRVIAAEMPVSLEERNSILFESVLGGRDVQHFPRQYREYGSQATIAAGKARPLAELRMLNPEGKSVLDEAISRSGLPESRLAFLPIKGTAADASMLIESSSGAIVDMVALRPWR